MTALANTPMHATAPPHQPSGRSCNTCTLCCRLPEIDELSKPANAWCVNCVEGKGCTIYADRPTLCRDFLCLWMTDARLGPEWDPATSHMMVYAQGRQLTVLVDPDYPAMWKTEPYAGHLRQWAIEAQQHSGYVIVFAGDDVFKVDPNAPMPTLPAG